MRCQAVIILACLMFIVAALETDVAYVSQSGEPHTTRLLPALQSGARTIILTGNYSLGTEFDSLLGHPLPINRNVTITGLPGQLPVLDLQAKPGVLELCSNCTFTFDSISTGNESIRGTGTMISILQGKGSSRVQHLNGYGLRFVCPQTNSSLAIINKTVRSNLFPLAGGLELAYVTNVCYEGKLYENQIHVDDISSDVPLQLLTGGYYVGGYALHRKNATRLCQYSVTDECISRLSPDECAAEIIANVTGANRPAAAVHNTVSPVVIAVPVAIAGAALLAVVGGVLLMKRRISSRKQPNAEEWTIAESNRIGSSAISNTERRSSGGNVLLHTGGNSGLNTALLPSASQPLEASQDFGLPLMWTGASGSGVWELSWRHTAPSMEWAADDHGIQLGLLLGAGSFARVFKAKWAGLDVAVKVIQHDTTTAAVVANEVQLMMHLNHPNIVRAYHCITKQHKTPAQLQHSPKQHTVQGPSMVGDVSSNMRDCAARPGSLPSSSAGPVVTMPVAQTKGLAQINTVIALQTTHSTSLSAAADSAVWQQPSEQQPAGQRRLSVLLPLPLPDLDSPATPVAATPQHQTVSWPSSALTRTGPDHAFHGFLSPASGSTAGPRTTSATGNTLTTCVASDARENTDDAEAAVQHRQGTGTVNNVTLPDQQHSHGTVGCINSSDSNCGNEFGPRSLVPAPGRYNGRVSRTLTGLWQPQQPQDHRRSGRSISSPNLGHQQRPADLTDAVQRADGDVVRVQLQSQDEWLLTSRPGTAGGATARGKQSPVTLGRQLGTTEALYVTSSSAASEPSTVLAKTAGPAHMERLLATARALYAPDSSVTGNSIGSSTSHNTTPVNLLQPGAGGTLYARADKHNRNTAAAAAVAAPAAPGSSAADSAQPYPPFSAQLPPKAQPQPVESWTDNYSAGRTRAGAALCVVNSIQQQRQQQQEQVEGAVVQGFFENPSRARRSSAPGPSTAWAQQQQQQSTSRTSLTAPAGQTSASSAAVDVGSTSQPYIQQREAYAAAIQQSSGAPGMLHTPGTDASSSSAAWPLIMDSLPIGSSTGPDDRAAGDEIGSMCETWLVTELCDMGTLARTAADWQPGVNAGDMLKLLWLLQDVARGLKLLHTKNIVHADLNAHNVLVSSSSTAPHGLVAKIADLGLSRIIKQQATHRTTRTVGTLSHQPPELLQHGHTSPAVDIYSFGVMMWEMYTGQAAFARMRYGQIYNQVVLLGARPPVPPDISDDYHLLMARCWAAAPEQRPSVDMLLDCLGLMIHHRLHLDSLGVESGEVLSDSSPLQAAGKPIR